jgi:hypothetical protein
VPLGLALVADEGGVESEIDAAEGFAEVVVALVAAIAMERVVEEEFVAEAGAGITEGRGGLIEEAGEEGGLDAEETFDFVLGDGDALDGVVFLGVDGAITGDGVLAEFGEGLDVFELGEGEGVGAEAVFAGVLGGAGLAFGGARPGGALGVGAVSGEPFFGLGLRCGQAGASIVSYGVVRCQRWLPVITDLLLRGIARRLSAGGWAKWEVMERKGD